MSDEKDYKDMTKKERGIYLFNKMKNNVNETFELLGLDPHDRKASLYTKHILKSNVKINLDDMQQYVLSNYNGFKYPPLELFTKGLGIMSESEKLATACDFAWSSAVQLMPYMKESTSYNSENKHMLYALNMIGIKRIVAAQEFVDNKTNRINPYQLNSFKKEFERYFQEALKNNLRVEEIKGSGSLVKEIAAPKPNQALLGSSESPLKMIDENVKRISENIMIEIGR